MAAVGSRRDAINCWKTRTFIAGEALHWAKGQSDARKKEQVQCVREGGHEMWASTRCATVFSPRGELNAVFQLRGAHFAAPSTGRRATATFSFIRAKPCPSSSLLQASYPLENDPIDVWTLSPSTSLIRCTDTKVLTNSRLNAVTQLYSLPWSANVMKMDLVIS